MATFNMISVLLLLSASTIVNGWLGNRFRIIRIKKPLPYKPPSIPVPKPTKSPAFSPVKDSRYCDESEISKLLSGGGRKKRAVSWPYDCTYPSIINNKGSYKFMYDIYTCCKKCDYPTYSTCVKSYGSPNWRCPSDGVHCILECVKTYGPGYTEVLVKPGGLKPWGGTHSLGNKPKPGGIIKVPKKLTCEKTEKLPNGKTCIRRLCVPLKP